MKILKTKSVILGLLILFLITFLTPFSGLMGVSWWNYTKFEEEFNIFQKITTRVGNFFINIEQKIGSVHRSTTISSFENTVESFKYIVKNEEINEIEDFEDHEWINDLVKYRRMSGDSDTHSIAYINDMGEDFIDAEIISSRAIDPGDDYRELFKCHMNKWQPKEKVIIASIRTTVGFQCGKDYIVMRRINENFILIGKSNFEGILKNILDEISAIIKYVRDLITGNLMPQIENDLKAIEWIMILSVIIGIILFSFLYYHSNLKYFRPMAVIEKSLEEFGKTNKFPGFLNQVEGPLTDMSKKIGWLFKTIESKMDGIKRAVNDVIPRLSKEKKSSIIAIKLLEELAKELKAKKGYLYMADSNGTLICTNQTVEDNDKIEIIMDENRSFNIQGNYTDHVGKFRPIIGEELPKTHAIGQESYKNGELRIVNPKEDEIVTDSPYLPTGISMMSVPLAFAGKIIGVIFLHRHEGQEKFNEEELYWAKVVSNNATFYYYARLTIERQDLTIAEQTRELIELDRLKSQFFSNISHEFRTPLTLIIGPLENTLEQNLQPKREQLEIMLNNARRLLRLINQLLDLSKLEHGKKEMKYQMFDLNILIKQIVSSFSSLQKEKGLNIQFTHCDMLEPVWLDPEAVDKIFFNLISNACKFTPKGGKVHVEITKDNEFVKISVADNGPGIPKNEQEQIFKRFQSNAKSSLQKGTGIGLSLAKELAELHQGKIELESEEGKGSTFTVYIPLGDEHITDEQKDYEIANIDFYEEAAEEIASMTKDDTDEKTEDIINLNDKRKVVLVVEDITDMRNLIQEILNENYQVIAAKNGKEGLEKALKFEPYLIISDVKMPIMNGYQLLSEVKGKKPEIPVILLTAETAKEDIVKGFKIGADDYIAKPFNAFEVLARVDSQVGRRECSENKAMLKKNIAIIALSLGLAHDIRNGVQIIAAYLKGLERSTNNLLKPNLSIEKREKYKPRLKTVFNDMKNTIENITQYINDIYNYAETGHIDVQEDMNITNIVDDVIAKNEQKAKDIQFEKIGFENIPILQGSIARLKNIIMNLFYNAIDAIHERKEKEKDLEGNIKIKACQEEQWITFSVEDNGCGIAQKNIDHIFDPYFSTKNKKDAGKGMGMSILTSCIQEYKGKIEIEWTKKNIGTKFKIYLPKTIIKEESDE